ncbi:hypothetical protein REPUB_Repub01dG0260000 [Reevesia pubescens]
MPKSLSYTFLCKNNVTLLSHNQVIDMDNSFLPPSPWGGCEWEQNYVDVIDTPMDFGTIWTNLRNGVKYMNSEDVYVDVECIWENCWKYTKKGDYTFYLMKLVKNKFLKYWTEAGLYSKAPLKTSNVSKRQSQYEPTHLPSSCYHPDQSKQPPRRTIWPQLSLLQPSIYRHPYQLEQPQSSYNPLQFSQLQTGTCGSSAVMKRNKSVPSCLASPIIDSASQPEPQQTHLREEQPNCMQQPEQITSQPQPPQIHATRDIGQSHLSPADSMRDENSASRGDVVHMTNSPSQEHEVQSGASHLQPKKSLAGPNQPLASQNGPYESEIPRRKHNIKRKTAVRKQNAKRKTLIPTQDYNLRNLLDGERIFIPINKWGQPVGPKATMLAHFLGKVARDGHLAPLNYANWRKMPDATREEIWLLVWSKFDIDASSKSWILKSIGKRWRDWKGKLKANHYYPHKTDEERLNDCHPKVLPDQWQALISYWNSDKVKLYSAKNKANAAKQKAFHTAGSKSFARIREEEKAKRPDGKEPSRAELYILTHTRKNGQPVDDEAAAIISKLREQATQRQTISGDSNDSHDTFFQVIGSEKSGRVRTYGLGPTPGELWGRKCVCQKRRISATEEESRKLDKMEAMEQKCARMEAQISRMTSVMQKYLANIGASSKILDLDQTLDPSDAHGDPLHPRGDTSSSNCAVPSDEVKCFSLGIFCSYFCSLQSCY